MEFCPFRTRHQTACGTALIARIVCHSSRASVSVCASTRLRLLRPAANLRAFCKDRGLAAFQLVLGRHVANSAVRTLVIVAPYRLINQLVSIFQRERRRRPHAFAPGRLVPQPPSTSTDCGPPPPAAGDRQRPPAQAQNHLPPLRSALCQGALRTSLRSTPGSAELKGDQASILWKPLTP